MTTRERQRREKRQIITRKKTKVVGSKIFIDQETGEARDFQVVSIEERDANFHKIWLQHVIYSLDIVGNQKTRLAFWILENMDNQNRIIMKQSEMAEATGISLSTVKDTLSALVDSNFLVRPYKTVYQVNPDVVFKGGKYDRMGVLLDYHQAKEENLNQDQDQEAAAPLATARGGRIPKAEDYPQGEAILFPPVNGVDNTKTSRNRVAEK